MAKKKKVEQVKEVITLAEDVKESVVKITNEIAQEAEVKEPAKKSKMFRARTIRKKLVRD